MINFKVGQVVSIPNDNRAMIIIGWNDNKADELYMIPLNDVNTHEMTNVISAGINDITPIMTTDINEEDIIDVENIPAKVVNATNKELGYIDVKYYHNPVIYTLKIASLNLSKKEVTKDIELCKHCGFVVFKDSNTKCPYENISEYKQELPKERIEATSVLKKILNGMDIKDYIPKKEAKKEEYDPYVIDYSEELEIGTKVRKFSSLKEGIIISRVNNQYVVDWEGIQESCWGQELLPIVEYKNPN